MRSTTYRRLIISFALMMLLCPLASATDADEPQTDRKPAPPPRSLLTISDEQALKLKPSDQEIRTLLITERTEVAALTAMLADTRDNLEALKIQRKIGNKKQQTEIGIMEVQAKCAEQAGRQEQAEAIREAIAGMKDRLAVALDKSGVE